MIVSLFSLWWAVGLCPTSYPNTIILSLSVVSNSGHCYHQIHSKFWEAFIYSIIDWYLFHSKCWSWRWMLLFDFHSDHWAYSRTNPIDCTSSDCCCYSRTNLIDCTSSNCCCYCCCSHWLHTNLSIHFFTCVFFCRSILSIVVLLHQIFIWSFSSLLDRYIRSSSSFSSDRYSRSLFIIIIILDFITDRYDVDHYCLFFYQNQTGYYYFKSSLDWVSF